MDEYFYFIGTLPSLYLWWKIKSQNGIFLNFSKLFFHFYNIFVRDFVLSKCHRREKSDNKSNYQKDKKWNFKSPNYQAYWNFSEILINKNQCKDNKDNTHNLHYGDIFERKFWHKRIFKKDFLKYNDFL